MKSGSSPDTTMLKQVLTFRSLNVLEAVKRAEIGKNTSGSAAGTTNSSDPLQFFHFLIRMRNKVLKIACFRTKASFNIS